MKESKLRKSVTVAVATIVFTFPAAVLAASPSYFESPSATVNFADLNLETEAGAKVLYRRLQRASKEVCGVTTLKNAGTISRLQKAQNCYRETLSNAVEKIDNDNLTRIHTS